MSNARTGAWIAVWSAQHMCLDCTNVALIITSCALAACARIRSVMWPRHLETEAAPWDKAQDKTEWRQLKIRWKGTKQQVCCSQNWVMQWSLVSWWLHQSLSGCFLQRIGLFDELQQCTANFRNLRGFAHCTKHVHWSQCRNALEMTLLQLKGYICAYEWNCHRTHVCVCVRRRAEFKLAALMFNTLHGLTSPQLSDGC